MSTVKKCVLRCNIHTKRERNIKKYEEKIEKIGLKHIVVHMMGEKINKNEAYEL